MKFFIMPANIGPSVIAKKGLKNSVNNARKAFNRFYTKQSCTGDIAHNKKSATI
jgi:hypothetical protein